MRRDRSVKKEQNQCRNIGINDLFAAVRFLLVAVLCRMDEIGITFYTDSSREESYVPVLRITALSGSERERLAVRTGRFILGRNDGVIYVGELLKGNQDWKYSVTEDEVRASFSLIGTEWSAGDN